MPEYAVSQPEAAELAVRILCDTLPAFLDAGYIVCATRDNQLSSIDRIALLRAEGWIKKILVCHGHLKSGYSGSEFVLSMLISRAITKNVVIFDCWAEEFNTFTETESLIMFAKYVGYKRIVISAPPFHQIRTFISCVSHAIKHYPELSLYSSPGIAMNWREKVTHSQGILEDTRANLIKGEWERLYRYHQKGDLVSSQEVLSYLNQRS